ncbi:MAG: hypothetical protein ABH865_03435 [Candidatus Omnitrophota bacterium]|nr:hypothetical protein [Candidatus Omnitrophota bacterium]
MKALALISGGLDSTLATKIVQDLGIELIAFNTVSPFCLCNHRSAQGCFHGAGAVARDLNLRMIVVNVAEEMIEIVKKPPHGYGSNMNPCIDCRILLFKKAKEAMERESAAFVITGEVVGQRPMSQKVHTMKHIEREADLEGFVVRPLSAKVLEPTIPEERGWIMREKLLDISGRGRAPQIALAKELGINDYPCPSGGCLLTDPSFSRRLRDQLQYGALAAREVQLLKIGRHCRLTSTCKLIVGRNEDENKRLLELAVPGDFVFEPKELPGPTGLVCGTLDQGLMRRAAGVIARYTAKDAQAVLVVSREIPSGIEEIISATGTSEDDLKRVIV